MHLPNSTNETSKSLNSFLAQNVLKLTSFHSSEQAREKNQHISSSQNTCYNTYFGSKLWNSLTFPRLSWYLKFPWPICKIPLLFPDLEEKQISLTFPWPVATLAQSRADKIKFSGIHGKVLGIIIDFSVHSIHLNFSLSSKEGEVSQFRETFSPKSPPKPCNQTCNWSLCEQETKDWNRIYNIQKLVVF